MSDHSGFFGTIRPKPIYRTARGQFRKETASEFRLRHDEIAWAWHLKKMKVLKTIAETNPYAKLLSR